MLEAGGQEVLSWGSFSFGGHVDRLEVCDGCKSDCAKEVSERSVPQCDTGIKSQLTCESLQEGLLLG